MGSGGYQNLSAGTEQPAPQTELAKRQRVTCPAPMFNGPEEARAYRDAVTSTPREAGESLYAWLERVARQACEKARSGEQLEIREPGEDG